MVSKHFFFELTGILLNYDRLLTLLHTPRVVTYQRVKIIQYFKDIFNYSESTRREKLLRPLSATRTTQKQIRYERKT